MLDDFEIAIFLTETSSRHAILKKDKRAKSEKPRMGATKGRLTGAGTQDVPVDVDQEGSKVIVREESLEDAETAVGNLPVAGESREGEAQGPNGRRDKTLLVSENSDDVNYLDPKRTHPRLVKEEPVQPSRLDGEDDKKKLALGTTYDGFTIYGRILCLVVKRKGNVRGKEVAGGAGQAMMEEWIASTQAVEGQLLDD